MSDNDPTPGGAGSGADPPPAGDGTGADPTPGGAGAGATYTQEQVDRLLADQRRRNESKFTDYDATKAKLAELEAAGKTELERAQANATAAEERAKASEDQRNRLLVRSAITASAARAGALDPDVVVALLSDTLKVDASGEIEGDVDKLVDSLLESKPFLKNGSTANHGSADGGVHGRAPANATPAGAMNDLLRKGR